MKNKEKKQLIIVAFLLIVFGAVWYLVVFGLPSGDAEPVDEMEMMEDLQVEVSDLPDDDAARELLQTASSFLERHDFDPEEYDAENRRDIFAPPGIEPEVVVGEEDPDELQFRLTAIVGQSASINGRTVSEGDMVAERVRVEEIRIDSVTLVMFDNDREETIELELKPDGGENHDEHE